MGDTRLNIFSELVNGINKIACLATIADVRAEALRLLGIAKPVCDETAQMIRERALGVQGLTEETCPVCQGQKVSQPENEQPDRHGIVRAKPQEQCWYCDGEGTVRTIVKGAPDA